MSTDPAAAALGALLCGAAGLAVPALVGRLPDPTVAAVAARSHLRTWAVVLSAVSGALVGGTIGLDWPLLFLWPLVPVAVALALVDLHTHLLPTRIIWPTAALTVVLAAVAALLEGDVRALAGAAVGGLLVFLTFHALWWIHPAGMGYGDVRLSALVGFALGYLGSAELVLGVYGAFVLFALLGLARAAARRDRGVLREPLPFGPFLLAGALAGIVLGGHLVSR